MSNVAEPFEAILDGIKGFEVTLSTRISRTVSHCVAYPSDTHTETEKDILVLVNAMAMGMADHVKNGSADDSIARSAQYFIAKIEALYEAEAIQAVDDAVEGDV